MRVGTRESGLAMKQTELLIAAMRAAGHDTEYEIVGIKAMGDADQTSPLDGFGDVGAFVRDLEAAMVADGYPAAGLTPFALSRSVDAGDLRRDPALQRERLLTDPVLGLPRR